MSLQGFYQTGYVTHDLERAIDLVDHGFGLSEFGHFEGELVLQGAFGERTVRLRVGTAWVGSHQIELIQPLSGFIEVYATNLPADPDDPTPCLHHIAVRRDDVEEMRRELASLGLPILFETGGSGLTVVYVDTRDRLGHYLELVCMTPERWETMGWPAGSRLANTQ